MRRSQTATEYLILLAVVIIIALIVVGILGGIPGIGGRLNEQTARAALSSSKIAVIEYAVSDYDTVLSVRNNNLDTVEVESISLDGEECVGFADFSLRTGESRQVTCQNVYEATSDRAEFPIAIGYASSQTQADYVVEGKELALVGPVSKKYMDILDNHASYTFAQKGCWNITTNPHPICTCYDLNKTRSQLTWNYTLQNNVDFERCMDIFGDAGWTSGSGWNPIGSCGAGNCYSGDETPFIGVFDGVQYLVGGLYINRPSTNTVGLFGNLYNDTGTDGKIKNIGVSGTVRGQNYVGGLVGYVYTATIDNSYAAVSVNGVNYIGGLAGEASSSIINNSYAVGSVSGQNAVGGLVGNAYSITINNSYATGSVSGVGGIGGLAGNAFSATIKESYATGLVTCTGTQYCGGLLGQYSPGSITASSWVNHTTDTAIACVGQIGNLGGTNPAGCSLR